MGTSLTGLPIRGTAPSWLTGTLVRKLTRFRIGSGGDAPAETLLTLSGEVAALARRSWGYRNFVVAADPIESNRVNAYTRSVRC
jgi:hypothetical protein